MMKNLKTGLAFATSALLGAGSMIYLQWNVGSIMWDNGFQFGVQDAYKNTCMEQETWRKRMASLREMQPMPYDELEAAARVVQSCDYLQDVLKIANENVARDAR
jgi:hypothetical protein